ncbi:MAG: hypothetical protein NT045_07895 [Candidatus Aureabacteria bacterium]|nr:hypothetical protein [Candidatus Auribacterota bacterium]
MELKINFTPSVEREIRKELLKGMFQTATFITIREMKHAYNLTLKNHHKSYATARSILERQFPEFFPQMRLFH